MDANKRAMLDRVFASHLVERNSWPEDAPSPETMDDFLSAIVDGYISDRRLRWFVRVLTTGRQLEDLVNEIHMEPLEQTS